VILVTTLILDRSLLKKVDYSLLLTFVGFFIFIGNMGRVEAFHQLLSKIVSGNEVITAVVSSQVISNVPAALLLSGFTEDYCGLVVGTNLGGLGTLIASMASLISYKYIAGNGKCKKSTYLFFFTWTNLLFLAILLGFWRIL
jgi:Na+/H+ antiporter NhaD/arsenite permease-like protein